MSLIKSVRAIVMVNWTSGRLRLAVSPQGSLPPGRVCERTGITAVLEHRNENDQGDFVNGPAGSLARELPLGEPRRRSRWMHAGTEGVNSAERMGNSAMRDPLSSD